MIQLAFTVFISLLLVGVFHGCFVKNLTESVATLLSTHFVGCCKGTLLHISIVLFPDELT